MSIKEITQKCIACDSSNAHLEKSEIYEVAMIIGSVWIVAMSLTI